MGGVMEKHFALIKNNIVEHVIVATDDFLSHLMKKYDLDLIIDVTGDSRPTAGDSYYPDTKTFIANHTVVHTIPVNLNAEHLHQGTEDGFQPFEMSQYSASYKDGMVTIGCKQYSAIGMLDTLHKLLVDNQRTTTYFTALKEGPAHGKFGITWDDAKKLHEALKKVKL
jgi:hypothetical protein